MSLYDKIYNVMNESEGLEKDLVVGSGASSYKAVGEKEVLNMLKPLFKAQKLIIFPVDGEINETNSIWEAEDYGKKVTKTRNVTQLKVKFKIVDIETNESEIIVGFGNGADSQDKGSGKAFTYAFKTALNKTFMLFSGEDTDNEHSDDIGKDKRQPTASKSQGTQQPRTQQPPQNSTSPVKCTKVQITELFKLSNERKAKFPIFEFKTLLTTMFNNGRISTQYTYSDREQTKINWTTEDYNSIKDELLLPF